MGRLLREEIKWKWTKREEDDFDDIEKMVTELSCFADFARDRYSTVTTDASRTGLPKTL